MAKDTGELFQLVYLFWENGKKGRLFSITPLYLQLCQPKFIGNFDYTILIDLQILVSFCRSIRELEWRDLYFLKVKKVEKGI